MGTGVFGPYKRNDKYRVVTKTESDGAVYDSFPTEDAAKKFAAFAREEFERNHEADAAQKFAVGREDFERNRTVEEVQTKPPCVVYFVQAGENGAIKIGISTSVEDRLAKLQTAHPEKLRLLATYPGGREEEQYLHGRFAQHRRCGEWFDPHRDLLMYISDARKPAPTEETRKRMAKKTIDSTEVRKISAELDCDVATVRKVFHNKKPADRPISKKIYNALVRDGYLDAEPDADVVDDATASSS